MTTLHTETTGTRLPARRPGPSPRAGSRATDVRRGRPGRLRTVAAVQGLRVLLLVLFSFPIVFMFVSSLKPDAQIFADLTSVRALLPVGDLTLDN